MKQSKQKTSSEISKTGISSPRTLPDPASILENINLILIQEWSNRRYYLYHKNAWSDNDDCPEDDEDGDYENVASELFTNWNSVCPMFESWQFKSPSNGRPWL